MPKNLCQRKPVDASQFLGKTAEVFAKRTSAVCLKSGTDPTVKDTLHMPHESGRITIVVIAPDIFYKTKESLS
jgi:hypothetical protein